MDIEIFTLLAIFAHLGGVLSAGFAVFYAATSSAAIAWSLTLILFPYISLPLFWIFNPGRARHLRALHNEKMQSFQAQFRDDPTALLPTRAEPDLKDVGFFEKIAGSQFSTSTTVQTVTDGEDFYKILYQTIESAQDYIFLQYYIIRDDRTGQELADRLIAKAQSGVSIYCLFDRVGSIRLGSAYIKNLKQAGIRFLPFRPHNSRFNPFFVNFRNHRKLLICDGTSAITGGSNIGNEYRGKTEKFGYWRDTNIKLSGGIVASLQQQFLKDWYWTTKEYLPDLIWSKTADTNPKQKSCLSIPTGPADNILRCNLYYLNLISNAQERFWLTTPYLVLDESVLQALQLAALRGVDVRILVPEKPDNYLVGMATYYFSEELQECGIKIYHYQPGFTHQKIIVLDHQIANVGTSNLDFRSLMLNFEVNVLFADRAYNKELGEIFVNDLENSKLADDKFFADTSFFYSLGSKVVRLFSPIL